MPSNISDEELVKKFREIGEMSIRSLVLDHFREELEDPSLEPMSRVFPKFPQYKMTSRLNVLNRLMVTTCLYKTWSAIQVIYPCLHDYCYVIGDADFMFMTRYPFIDIRTHETHGVETVLDFVEFIMEFIIDLCLPCMYKSDKSCVVLRKEMKDALDKCIARGSECPETRRKLLNFVIDNLKSNKAGSATKLAVPLTKSEQVTTFVDESSRRVRFGEIGHTFKAKTEEEYPGMFEVSVNERVPTSHELRLAEIKRDAVGGNFGEMTDYAVWGIMAGTIQNREEVFQLTFDEFGEADVEYISSGGIKHFLYPEAKKILEREINMITAQIKKDGSLKMLALVERNSYLDKHPFSTEIRCCPDEKGQWKATFSVEVVGHKMRISDLDHLRNMFTTNHVGSNPSMFFENSDPGGVKMEPDFENMPHMSYDDQTSGHAMNYAQTLLDIPFEINDGVTHEKIAETAQSFMEAFYRTKADVGLNDRVSGMILLGESLVKNSPHKLDEMLNFVKDNLRMRHTLSEINGKNELETLLKKAHYLAGERAEKPGTIATLNTIERLKGVPLLRNAVLDALEKSISSLGCKYLDRAVEEELGESKILKAHIKSPRGMKELEKAYDDARLMRLDKASNLTWWWKLMRKQLHGFKVKVPLNFGFFRAMRLYNKIEEELLYNEEALDLFEKMCINTAYRPLLCNASTLEYKDVTSMWNDVDLALQKNQPRMGKDDWLPQLHDVEWDFFKDIILFMCLYAILWGMFMKSNKGAQTVGHHAAVVVLGWCTERADLLLAHFLFTGILCNSWNYTAQYLSDKVTAHLQEENNDGDGGQEENNDWGGGQEENNDGGGGQEENNDGGGGQEEKNDGDGGQEEKKDGDGGQEEKNDGDGGQEEKNDGGANNSGHAAMNNLPVISNRNRGSGAGERSGLVLPGRQLRGRYVPP
ncbi:unnamed protein product [Ectocarpus sp. 8 AP-2014]